MAELKSISYINGEENLAFNYENEKEPEPSSQGKHVRLKDVSDVSPPQDISIKKRKIKTFANLIILCFSFVLLFTAFQSLQNLQSSLHPGLGTPSLSAIYAALIFSNIFIAPFAIKRFGCKNCLVVCSLMYCLYIAANIKKDWYQYTSIPTAIILGTAGAPLWGSQSTYITKLGIQYSALQNEDPDSNIPRFFGIFGLMFQSSQIWGNLIAMFILSPSVQELNNTIAMEDLNITSNYTSELNVTKVQICGINFCPLETSPGDQADTDENQIYLLVGIYLACGLTAVLIIFLFLDNVEQKKDNEEPVKFSPHLLIATFSQLKNDYRQMLVVFLTTYVGFEVALLSGDYTLAFVTCSMNISQVGSIMICYGITNALCSYAFGYLTKLVGRIPIFTFAFLSSLAIMITLNLWEPHTDQEVIFYVIVGIWGMNDAVWQSQILALYGALFSNNQEAAFANKGVWESLGYTIAFAYSGFLCMQIKVSIVICFLLVGFSCYLFAEYIHNKGTASKEKEILDLKY